MMTETTMPPTAAHVPSDAPEMPHMTADTFSPPAVSQAQPAIRSLARPLAPVVKDMDNPAWQALADRFHRAAALPLTRDPIGNGGYTHGMADAVRREHRRRRDARMRVDARTRREGARDVA